MLSTLRGAVPLGTKMLSAVLGATTTVCSAASERARVQRIPWFCEPARDVISRGLEGTSMVGEFCNTLLVSTALGAEVAEAASTMHSVEALPPPTTFRLWSTVFAGMARLATSNAALLPGDAPSFASAYCGAMAANRAWVFAYAGGELHAAAERLRELCGHIATMRRLLLDEASYEFKVVSVYDTWVQFVHCLTAAAAEARTEDVDRSLERVGAHLESVAARSLSIFDMHTVCWILDGIRTRFDEAAMQKVVSHFASHGLAYATLDRHVTQAFIALTELC
jgi:hypothetical protein